MLVEKMMGELAYLSLIVNIIKSINNLKNYIWVKI